MPIAARTPEISTFLHKLYCRLNDLTRWEIMNWNYELTRFHAFYEAYQVHQDGAGMDLQVEHWDRRTEPPTQRQLLAFNIRPEEDKIVVTQVVTKTPTTYGVSDSELDRLVNDVRSILVGYLLCVHNFGEGKVAKIA